MKTSLKRALITGLLIATLCGGQGTLAQDKSAAVQSFAPLKIKAKKEELAARLERAIPQLMQDGYVPGLAAALIRDGRVFWQRSFGVKNSETKEPVDESTVFEAASLSKPVFAYLVLKLVDEGRLDLDTPLTKYLPGAYIEGDERLKQITARRVLSHTTGFPNWRPRGGELKIFFEPGEKFSYSGEGFVYLQKVVEHLLGERLDASMKRLVFDPLGMTSSSYVWQSRYKSLKAFGHNLTGDVTQRREPDEANAAASLNTTATDYARFVIAVMNGTGLKRETARLMLTPQIKVDDSCTNCAEREPGRLSPYISWGLGWGLQHTDEGDSFWHWGDSNNDVQCYIVAFPKQKLGLIVFTNSGNGHAIIPEIIKEAIGGRHPAIAWLKYEPYNSPTRLLFKEIMARGLDAIKEYRERKTRPGSAVLNELQMNRLGYALLQKRKVQEAIEIFKLNVEDFPQSSNVYDSLAEAYMINGERELAIKNYRKSIELNPKNQNGIEMLKKLEQQ
ncbi:MAG TPA: serine hydrolase [Pyrinomonadaceae bacterium]